MDYNVWFVVVDRSVSLYLLPPWLVFTDFGTCSYQCFLSNCNPVSLHMLKCSCAHTLSSLFMYCSFPSIGHADIMWFIVSSNCWQSLHMLSVSVSNIFVAYYFARTLGVVLPLYHFQFLLLGLPSTTRGTLLYPLRTRWGTYRGCCSQEGRSSELRLRRGVGQAAHTLNNLQVECTGVLLCVIRE